MCIKKMSRNQTIEVVLFFRSDIFDAISNFSKNVDMSTFWDTWVLIDNMSIDKNIINLLKFRK